MIVHIPTPLRAYTNASQVEANGATLAALFADLDRQFPGIRFRIINEQDQIREHIKIFVNQTIAPNLDAPLAPNDRVQIIMAISGG
ncbi:Sulfur carrier protein CysO [Anaerolineae bacterium]|nr:Sulfur carrier protein CysO [Anaerolineae bacterium]